MTQKNNFRELYKKGLNDLFNSSSSLESHLSFLDMASYQYKLPIHSIVQLFAVNHDYQYMATYANWKNYGRQVTSGQKGTKIWLDNKAVNLFDVRQTIKVEDSLINNFTFINSDNFLNIIEADSSGSINDKIHAYVINQVNSVWTDENNVRKDYVIQSSRRLLEKQLHAPLSNTDELKQSISNVMDQDNYQMTDMLKDTQLSLFLLKNAVKQMMLVEKNQQENLETKQAVDTEGLILPKANELEVDDTWTLLSPSEDIEYYEGEYYLVDSKGNTIPTELEILENEDKSVLYYREKFATSVEVLEKSEIKEKEVKTEKVEVVPEEKQSTFIFDNGIDFLKRMTIEVNEQEKTVRVLVNNSVHYPKGGSLKSKEFIFEVVESSNYAPNTFSYNAINTDNTTIFTNNIKELRGIFQSLKECTYTDENFSIEQRLTLQHLEHFVITNGEEIYGRTASLNEYIDYFEKKDGVLSGLKTYEKVDLSQPFTLFNQPDITFQLLEDNQVLLINFTDQTQLKLAVEVSDSLGTHRFQFDNESNKFKVESQKYLLEELELATVSSNYLNDTFGKVLFNKELFTGLEKISESKQMSSEPVKYEYVKFVEIKEKHINFMLKRGSGFKDGKLRIKHIMDSDLPTKDKVAQLKAEYGEGGSSGRPVDEGLDLAENHTARGIKLIQAGTEVENTVLLNWGEVYKRLESLIQANAYLTDEELEQYYAEYGRPEVESLSLFDFDDSPSIEVMPSSSDINQVDTNLVNFNFEEHQDLYPKTNREKIEANINALKLLKDLDDSKRLATPEEQLVLAKYVGWGGLPDVFDERKEAYNEPRMTLRSLVSEAEYRSMRESVLTAYYTSPMIINEMYQKLEDMGFTGGSVLDPAMGTGNFFSAMPSHLKENSTLHGVELEDITGKIAKQLNQTANIQIKGFETTKFKPQQFDIVVGNVPFNNFTIEDNQFKKSYLIHDYFFKKSLDLVKDGGIVAFITSTGTLDKKSKEFRHELNEQADFLGAVRLPNNAFKDIAGTDVTTDIIFFQRNDNKISKQELWLDSSDNIAHEGVRYNDYFISHPNQLLGRIEVKHFNGLTFSLKPLDEPLQETLHNRLTNIHGQISEPVLKEVNAAYMKNDSLVETQQEIDPETLPLFTYVIAENGDILYRDNDDVSVIQPKTAVQKRLRQGILLREKVQELIALQQEDYSLEEFETVLTDLNTNYDRFVSDYGAINDYRRQFEKDMYYPILLALETKNEDGSYSKSELMYEPTIRPLKSITSVNSAVEGLHISLAKRNKVDFPFIQSLYSNKSEEDIINELGDLIYLEPTTLEWQTREEYLSGDVKSKLHLAKVKSTETPDLFLRNVEGLLKVQPTRVEAKDIDLTIGTNWIPQDVYETFLKEVLEVPNYYLRHEYIRLNYEKFKGTWFITGQNALKTSYIINDQFGTPRANALSLFNDALNLKKVTIYDSETYYEDGKEKTKRILNPKETMFARAKQNELYNAFNDWVFKDYERTERLVSIYNERFNRFVPRVYDGSHLTFDSLNQNYELRPHQKNVVSRITSEGRALMAHVVGAGKTLSMISAGMTMKEQGTIHKPMYVVPNHLVNEFALDIVKFYPTKNVLITTKRDFQKENRKQFVAKVASGNYDAVVIGHSQFEKIPLSKERRKAMIEKEIDVLRNAIAEEKAENNDSWSLKQMLRFEKTLEKNLEKLNKESDKDTHITFEETGVDFLFVDEAHVYKNLYTYTKLSNVAGVNSSHSQRASDMQMKISYLQDTNTGGKGIVMATGTPISNSMSELYTMQRYLQPDMLRQLGCETFDSWASTFGEITSSLEITPEGSGYQMKDRFAKFHNLPELMSNFSQVADIQTSDMLDLPTPDIKTGKAQVIVTEPTEFQEEMMEQFAERAELIRAGEVEPSEDNLLKLTHEAKLMAIDVRLLDEDFPSGSNSKLETCSQKVFEIWKDSQENLSTQMIFSDSGTPKKDKFNVYDELKNQLIAKGIPSEEIAFIHDAKTDQDKKDLYSKVRTGTVRVLLGSTSKVGTGTNIQDKLLAVHHIDCPWRPSDIEQRNGRIIRQGNENKEVEIFQYVTKGTFDSFLWQTQENKLLYINQIMNGNSLVRSSADLSETVLSAAEIKALATSNPFIAEKMNVENELNQLRLVKNQHTQSRLKTMKKINETYPNQIERSNERIKNMSLDVSSFTKTDEFNMTIAGTTFTERKEAGDYMISYISNSHLLSSDKIEIGEIEGFKLSVQPSSFSTYIMTIKKNHEYQVDLNLQSGTGSILRVENVINKIDSLLESEKESVEMLKKELEKMKERVDQPFPKEERLTTLQKRHFELESLIEKGTLEKEAETAKKFVEGKQKSQSQQVKSISHKSQGMSM